MSIATGWKALQFGLKRESPHKTKNDKQSKRHSSRSLACQYESCCSILHFVPRSPYGDEPGSWPDRHFDPKQGE